MRLWNTLDSARRTLRTILYLAQTFRDKFSLSNSAECYVFIGDSGLFFSVGIFVEDKMGI